MHSLRTFTGLSNLTSSSSSIPSSYGRLLFPFPSPRVIPVSCPSSSLRAITAEPSKSQYLRGEATNGGGRRPIFEERVPLDSGESGESDGSRGGDDEGVSGINVPRHKYIPVSKADLLEALLSTFESKEDADEFARFASCLDSVLHAEHKVLLEELRLYHSVTNFQENNKAEEAMARQKHLTSDGSMWKVKINGMGFDKDFHNQFDMRNMFERSTASAFADGISRVAVAARFQQTLLKVLRDAQFEEISAQDLLLTRALKTDYLLTLPIYVDWKKAFQSNAIIFRRGYTAERQRGVLIVEKLDYLQSKFLQEIFFLLSKPLKNISIWINEALKHLNQNQEIQGWCDRTKAWFMERPLPQNLLSYIKNRYTNKLEYDQDSVNDLPIWLAAQRAVPVYEGLLSSVGPRGRLIRRLLTWIGIIPSSPEIACELDNKSTGIEPYLRPIFLPRITLSDIWEPATKQSCGNNLWKMLKSSISILFTQSNLQEPAFQELILLYTEDVNRNESKVKDGVLPLQLKIYEKIPIPDLPVIFPHKKLSFRILDTIRLDIASIVGLLAFFVNYKFETIISSPSAFLLDVIALSALFIYATRVALGYKQTWDRYQLLVNRTLYEKTLASGFGSVHFLLDASEQQQYKEAILAYALLLHSEMYQVFCRKSTKDACERFIYDKFAKKVEMPIDSALETLLRLKIVIERPSKENFKVEALSCSRACDALKHCWDTLLGQNT